MNEPVKINEQDEACPICKQKARSEEYVYNIPYYGDILISVTTCSYCGFKNRDVKTMSSDRPKRIIYKVEKPGDEKALLIRAGGSRIIIPELNLEISPGPFSQGFITTVEGLIMDFIEKSEFLCESYLEKPEECERVRELLSKAKDGLVSYTVIIDDYSGKSDIVSERTIYEDIRENEEKKES
ncbi:MAG: ZPR1 zinc finger domain-containing protein [Thermosphaera sp.]